MIKRVFFVIFMISLAFQEAALCSIPGYTCYRTVEETYGAAQTLVANYPELATLLDIGDSWEKVAPGGSLGYDLMVLVLTNGLILGQKPKLFVSAGLGARHYAAPELALRFAEHLLQSYDTDADINWILDHQEIHFLFFANPDGRKQAETGLSWVKNTNENYCSPTSIYRGAALDRNFPFQWGCCGGSSGDPCNQTYRGQSPASEPETQALQSYLRSIFDDQRDSDLSSTAPTDSTGVLIDLQAYGESWLWPWGFTDTTAPNGVAMQTMGRKLAFFNGFTPLQQVDLYPVDGDLNDFVYGDLGVISFTAMLGTSFFQGCSAFEETIVPETLPALLYGAKVARAPYQTPAGPDIRDFSIPTDLITFGSSHSFSAVADDTRYNNSAGTEPIQNIVTAEFYIDTPPWSITPTPIPLSLTASDGSFDETVETVEATLDTSSLSVGKHTIFMRAADADNNWGPVTAQFVEIVSLENVITALQIAAGYTPESNVLETDVDDDGRIGLGEAIMVLRKLGGL